MRLLDGRALAKQRESAIAQRAAAVLARRHRSPTLVLLAFAEPDGRVLHIGPKLRACERTGIAAVCLPMPADSNNEAAARALQATVATHDPDAVFVQVPLPPDPESDVVLSAIPIEADVDIMTTHRYQRFMSGADPTPPLTVSAALLLLDASAVSVAGRRGVLVASTSPFSRMFHEALVRRGAAMEPLLDPADPMMLERVQAADLVVVAAGSPGLVPASRIRNGAVAIDVGYFNPGGRGDIDTASGFDHLAELMPVPGGIGPMTVSALLERVVQFAEQRCP